MKMDELERLARAATPAGGGDISPFLDACSPERILALVAVAKAAKSFRNGPSLELRDALAALEKLT